MDFKFAVGQMVEYKPVGRQTGLFHVTRQMPEEFQAIDRRYRIKSPQESFERNVLECDLTASDKPQEAYDTLPPPRRSGGAHH